MAPQTEHQRDVANQLANIRHTNFSAISCLLEGIGYATAGLGILIAACSL